MLSEPGSTLSSMKIEFELDESIGVWSYGDQSFERGETHSVTADAELSAAIGAAASAGALKLIEPETLAGSVESDKDSAKAQANPSEEQEEERQAVFKLMAEHDFNCNRAAAAFNEGKISESVLDALQTESGERLTSAIAQVQDDPDLRRKLAASTPRTLTAAIDTARELMGRQPIQDALEEESG